MKKYLVLVFCFCLLFTSACGTAAPATTTAPAATTTPAATTAAPVTPATTPVQEKEAEDFNVTNEVVPNRPYKIVFANSNDQNPICVEVRDGFIEAAKDYGIELWVMDNKLDPAVANSNVDMAIAAGDVDYYIQYNQVAESNTVLGDKLLKANIPSVAVQVPMVTPDGHAFPFYGMDNYGTGYLAGEMLGKSALEKWGPDEDYTFFCLGFPESGELFQQRAQGSRDGVMLSFPDIKIVDESTTGKQEVARQRTVDFLTANPEGKILIWTHSDEVTASVIVAVEASNRTEDTLIVSNAMAKSMLDMIREPETIIAGTIDLLLGEWGSDLMPLLITALNEGTDLEERRITPFDIVTPQNVQEKYPK